MSLLGGALIVLLRAAGEQEGKGASSVSPATRPRGRHNFCGQQESTSPEGGFLVNLSQQMAPFSGGRITGESPPARLLHAGGRVGSVGVGMFWAIFGPPMFPYCSRDSIRRGGDESRHLHPREHRGPVWPSDVPPNR